MGYHAHARAQRALLTKNKVLLLWMAVALCVGALYADSLEQALAQLRLPPPLRSSPPLRMVLPAHSATGPISADRAQLPVELAPARTPRTKTGQQQMPVADPKTLPAPVVQDKPSDKPATASITESNSALPGPPAPPDHEEQLIGRVYTQKPGGDSVVLALLVDSRGNVISVRIMVPSGYPLLDTTYKLAAMGVNVGPPDPPLKEGDTVWKELAFRFDSKAVNLP
jgi:hypothetical protein